MKYCYDFREVKSGSWIIIHVVAMYWSITAYYYSNDYTRESKAIPNLHRPNLQLRFSHCRWRWCLQFYLFKKSRVATREPAQLTISGCCSCGFGVIMLLCDLVVVFVGFLTVYVYYLLIKYSLTFCHQAQRCKIMKKFKILKSRSSLWREAGFQPDATHATQAVEMLAYNLTQAQCVRCGNI